MSDNSTIEWTEATLNPVTGCTKVSPGCDRCYAETFAERFRGVEGHHFQNGFDLQLRPDKLALPLRWKKPRRIFVNSMSDLFHADVPDEYIARMFAVMAATPRHTYQVLTKRHARMRSLANSEEFTAEVRLQVRRLVEAESWQPSATWLINDQKRWPLPNLWLGVSVEDQQWAETRIPALLQTPAAVRWISAEPLLGPVDLRNLRARNGALIDCLGGDVKTRDGREVYSCAPSVLDWVVVGGESGRGARRMDAAWARALRDQCGTAHAAFLFKQAGSVLAREWGGKGKGGDPAHWPEAFPREYPVVTS